MNYIEEAIAIIVGCIVIGIGIFGYAEHVAINDLRSQLQTALDQKSACDATNENWKLQAASQNDAINKLSAAIKQREADTAKAVAAAQSARDKAATKAAAIMAQPVNKDDCKGAMEVLQSYIGRKP